MYGSWRKLASILVTGISLVSMKVVWAEVQDYSPVYSAGITSRYLKIAHENGQIKPRSETIRSTSFEKLFDLDDRQVQCVFGKHPPQDFNNPGATPERKEDENCVTTLIKKDEDIVLGFSLENYPETQFRLFLPPGTKEIPYMRFFLVQNQPFTVALHLDEPPSVTECNGENIHDAGKPCIKGGSIFITAQDYDKLFAGEDLILEKYLSERVDVKLFKLQDKLGNEEGHWIYFKVLRNAFRFNGVPVIGKFEAGLKVNGFDFVRWFRDAKANEFFRSAQFSNGQPVVQNTCPAQRIDDLIKKLNFSQRPIRHRLDGEISFKNDNSASLKPYIDANSDPGPAYSIDLGNTQENIKAEKVYFVYRFTPKGETKVCDGNGTDLIQWKQLDCQNGQCMAAPFDRTRIKPFNWQDVNLELSKIPPEQPGNYEFYFGIINNGKVEKSFPFVFELE